jgi:clan AA aspartic protease
VWSFGVAETPRQFGKVKLPFAGTTIVWYIYLDRMERRIMGTVYADITLKNAQDVGDAEDGLIKGQQVRETAVRAMVDTGAITLVINEALREKLGLKVRSLRRATYANNQKEICKMAGPVEVHWKDRLTLCEALVLPGDGEVLLGSIPLESMDLIVNPARQELIGAHGDDVVCLVM